MVNRENVVYIQWKIMFIKKTENLPFVKTQVDLEHYAKRNKSDIKIYIYLTYMWIPKYKNRSQVYR